MRLDALALPAFFLANAVVTAVLIPALGVRDPTYNTFPWIFGVAFAATLVPALRRRLTDGPLPWRLLPPLLYAGVITLASAVRVEAPVPINTNAFHPVEYAGLAFVAQLAANGGLAPRPRPARLAVAALACVGFGVIDELHQAFVPGRLCSAVDVGLDTLGTVVGTALFLALRRIAARR